MSDTTFNIYCIEDVLNKRFGLPFFHSTDLDAMRFLRMQTANASDLTLYPQHFNLVKIGSYNQSNGLITNNKQGNSPLHKVLGNITQVLEELKAYESNKN